MITYQTVYNLVLPTCAKPMLSEVFNFKVMPLIVKSKMGYWVGKAYTENSRYIPSSSEYFFRVTMDELKPITLTELLDAAQRFAIPIPEEPTKEELYDIANEIHNSVYGCEFADCTIFPYRTARICLSEERKQELALDLF